MVKFQTNQNIFKTIKKVTMKISKIELLQCDGGWRPWLFIKITTDEGLIGYSECTDSHGSPRGIAGVIKDLEKILIGKNPLACEKLFWEMYSATRQSSGSIIQKAIGGIENALLDIKGKFLNVPVYELFGGPVREKTPVYWSHWGTTRVRAANYAGVKPILNLEDVSEFVSETKQRGFNCVKTNVVLFQPEPQVYMPGFGKSLGGPQLDISPDIISNLTKYIGKIREAGGESFGIILDLNFNFKNEGYTQIAKAIEPFNLAWLEVDSYDPKALAQIKKSTKTPLCSGENLYTNRQFRPYFENYSMDIASIDVIWNGFHQSKKIADLAEIYEINVTPHNYYSHLATFISAHFAAVTPNFKTLEVDVDDVPWKDNLTTDIPKIENGLLTLSKKPGWGADINEEVLNMHPWQN